ncbi:hypothetical protein ACSQ67_011945 [Phaseolus vulgaris]
MGYNRSSTAMIISRKAEKEKHSGWEAEHEKRNRETVKMVYKAQCDGHKEKLVKLVRTELEWWYHGPHHCEYMMRLLTGESTAKGFRFRPRRIRAIGDRVMLREYFNTFITVVLRVSEDGDEARLWRSSDRVRVRVHGSLPDLVLSV